MLRRCSFSVLRVFGALLLGLLALRAHAQIPTISTLAGNGSQGFSGDGGSATSAQLNNPSGVAVDSAGNLYIADFSNNRIRKVRPAGVISTVAGNGSQGFSGDGGNAASAQVSPSGVAVDSAGNLYIADFFNNRIRKVTPEGVISTAAGNGIWGFSGDGGSATSAQLKAPNGVAVDSAGNLYIADFFNNRIRKVTPAGVISTVAGNGIGTGFSSGGFSGDGGSATSAQLNQPEAVAVDSTGNLYIADSYNNRIRKVTPAGVISTVAGNGSQRFSGDGGRATSAQLDASGVAVDSAGNLYIADSTNYRIRKVTPAGVISTVAGNGSPGFSGDGGSATSAQVDASAVAVDSTGNLYIAGSNRIRKVTQAAASGPTFALVNAADYTPAVAPGMIVALFGDAMASQFSSATGTPLPTALDGTSVEVNGQDIPLFFISPQQINAQMPFGISGQVQVRVRTAAAISAPVTVNIVATAPRLFTKTMDGIGEAVLCHNADWSLVSAGSPARPGEYLILFLTGLGAVSPPIPAGQAAGDNDTYGPLNQLPSGAVTIDFGGKHPAIIFAGLAPHFVGLYQVNFQVPADILRGRLMLRVNTRDGSSQVEVFASVESR